jgi:hypothetical protein
MTEFLRRGAPGMKVRKTFQVIRLSACAHPANPRSGHGYDPPSAYLRHYTSKTSNKVMAEPFILQFIISQANPNYYLFLSLYSP